VQLGPSRAAERVARGDWQTPPAITEAVAARVEAMLGRAPGAVLEPTCGVGAFLAAARARWPGARLVGVELEAAHAAEARVRVPGATIVEASAFDLDFARALEGAPAPLLVLGNPPWVTLATLGAIGAENAPPRARPASLVGLDALTGRANFDLAEWTALALARSLAGRDAAIALLCKASVARRLALRAAAGDVPLAPGAVVRIEARRIFGAAVEAVLFVARVAPSDPGARWPVFASLDATAPASALAVEGGALVADADAFARTRHLAGRSSPAWRSGVKHDCAPVMELSRDGDALVNGLGERVDLEPEHVLPLLKGTDVARGRLDPRRAVVVPQRALGDDTASLASTAPRTHAYLDRHRDRLASRRSKVYRGRPPFAIFGVGPYAFAPWKVAVSGLHRAPSFALVGPHEGRPVLFDDTCYFLPFEDEAAARRAHAALVSPLAADFFRARLFADDKRPVTKALLGAIDLEAVARYLPR
jgi:SAM-dependent methyltransferase